MRGGLGLAVLPAALALLALPGAGCIEVPAPPVKNGAAVSEMTVPPGVAVDATCVPTGVEICFDAKDNNCNGVIDEGCGLHTGILQFVIAWEAAKADVDLEVFDPTGESAKVGETAPSSGLLKDKDCPRAGECQGQNVENVYLAEGDPRPGHYRVKVRLDKLDGETAPIKVRLGARVGSRSYGMVFELSPGSGTEEKEFGFTVQ